MLTKLRMLLLVVRLRWRFGLVCWLLCHSVSVLAAEPLAGKPFEAALDKKVGVAWGGQIGNTLRDVVRQLAESQHVSIILDRRVDPTQSIELTIPPTPLREVLAALAHRAECETSIVSNVVYVGPIDSAKKLRTLVELRNGELSKLMSNAAPAKSPWRNRPVSLTRRMTLAWQDLDRPHDILQQVAVKFQIEIDGLDKLPHDLWAGASLPQSTAIEALSLLLVQFGSTFEFVPDRAAVRIVPIPQRVLTERTHAVPANSPVTLEACRKQFADVEIEQSGSKWIVRGTVEQHADIATWLKPGGQKPLKPAVNTPLSQRRFKSIKQDNVSLGDVIKTFTDYGVKFSYDAEEFAEAGISLEKKIDINTKDASVETLFRELFKPAGIEVTIDGETVRLRPKGK
ncbi:MAG: hypothetical protein FD138_2477 [Planctomycetota bacterium]|nr:MAG: hypothetical protein FD138_2477 [Planctomycetota bacterium]